LATLSASENQTTAGKGLTAFLKVVWAAFVTNRRSKGEAHFAGAASSSAHALAVNPAISLPPA
jgi:hypothetical protein